MRRTLGLFVLLAVAAFWAGCTTTDNANNANAGVTGNANTVVINTNSVTVTGNSATGGATNSNMGNANHGATNSNMSNANKGATPTKP